MGLAVRNSSLPAHTRGCKKYQPISMLVFRTKTARNTTEPAYTSGSRQRTASIEGCETVLVEGQNSGRQDSTVADKDAVQAMKQAGVRERRVERGTGYERGGVSDGARGCDATGTV